MIRFVWAGSDAGIAYTTTPGHRIPVRGEHVHMTGHDPDFPKGSYTVTRVTWCIGITGITDAVVELEREIP